MNIVILGDADSIYIKDFIQHVLVKKEDHIYLVTPNDSHFSEFYEKNNIIRFKYEYEMGSRINRNRVNKILVEKILETIGQIDVIHVHYFHRKMIRICWKLWVRSKKRIITFWGSDLLRVHWLRLRIYKPILRQADYINVMSEEMLHVFGEIYGKRLANRVNILDFGNPMYETISDVAEHMSKDECKDYWEIERGKIVVPVGYNSKQEQQHILLINELAKLPEEYKKRITIVLHFGYGQKSCDYLETLKRTMNDNCMEYVVIERFLDKNEIAILRLAADIFLYGQTTDALAGSVLEYLYAGTVLVKPKWLQYSALDRIGVSYIQYDNFKEIPFILKKLLDGGLSDYTQQIRANREKLRQMNSWEMLSPKWKQMYGNRTVEKV